MEYELYHHGILGMKWGIRRWQNKDGSLTAAGRRRYRGLINDNDRVVSDTLLVKKFDEGERSHSDLINDVARKSRVVKDEFHKAYTIGDQERRTVTKSKKFEKRFEELLRNELGDGCDDDNLFYLTEMDCIESILTDPDFFPKTNEAVNKLQKSIDKYNDTCEKATLEIAGDLKDVKTIKYFGDYDAEILTGKQFIRSIIRSETLYSDVSRIQDDIGSIYFGSNYGIDESYGPVYDYSLEDYNNKKRLSEVKNSK